MSWFWPFSKNTPPVSTEPVATGVATPIVMPVSAPVAAPVATPVDALKAVVEAANVSTSVTKPVSTLLDNLVTTLSPCLPCKIFSFWKQNEPAVAALASEPVALPLTSDPVTVVNESAALDSEILANPQLKIRPVEPA